MFDCLIVFIGLESWNKKKCIIEVEFKKKNILKGVSCGLIFLVIIFFF